jgi:hypothetical protein
VLFLRDSKAAKRDFKPADRLVSEFIVHPEWLIAQCDFTGVIGISDSMKDALKHYTDKI